MADTSNLRITSGPRGSYRLVTNSEPPAILGNIDHVDTVTGSGWRYRPNTFGHRPSRKLWPSPEAAIAAFGIVPAKWAREQVGAVDAGEA